jgi:hypothetical protein
MAIGELLDEIICHLRDVPIDETHRNFGQKYMRWLDDIKDSRKNNQSLSGPEWPRSCPGCKVM